MREKKRHAGKGYTVWYIPVCWAIANLAKELFHQSPSTIPAKGRSHCQLPRFNVATQLNRLNTAVLPTGDPAGRTARGSAIQPTSSLLLKEALLLPSARHPSARLPWTHPGKIVLSVPGNNGHIQSEAILRPSTALPW